MRLVDADKMRENLEWCKSQSGRYDDIYWDDVIERLDVQPTVDAVHIIRCKDCINWDTDWTTHPPDHYCPAIDGFTSADFYCGYSEKKEVKEQQCTSTDTAL